MYWFSARSFRCFHADARRFLRFCQDVQSSVYRMYDLTPNKTSFNSRFLFLTGLLFSPVFGHMKKEHRPRRRAFGAATRRSRSLTLASCCRSHFGVAFGFRAEFKQLQSGCGSRSRLKEATATSCCAEGASAWSAFFSKGDR